jgi:hypothetical protein
MMLVTLTDVKRHQIKVKGKAVPVLNNVPRHEDVLGCGGTVPLILNLGTGSERSVSRPVRFIPGEKAPGTH